MSTKEKIILTILIVALLAYGLWQFALLPHL